MATAHEGSGATFNWQLKECRNGERFEESVGAARKVLSAPAAWSNRSRTFADLQGNKLTGR